MSILALTVLVFFLSIIFTYTNGFQDGSSVAAGAIASRALSRLQTIILVALFEFLGALFGGSAVSHSIQALTNWPRVPSLLPVLASALFAAILWNYITKVCRFPSSSTHALVGGMIGAVFAGSGGFQHIVWGDPDHVMHSTGIWKVIFSLFLSPAIGFAAGYVCLVLTLILLHRATTRANRGLKQLQIFTTAVLAFAHGANDTQKAMGLLVLTLNAAGYMHGDDIPLWVRLLSGSAMAIGVASLAPGIVKRVGLGIYRLRPLHGFVTEFSSAVVVLIGSLTGGPVSASQVIASAVMGVGSAQRKKGVHWLVARDMLVAWFLTIPCSGLLACGLHLTIFHFLNNVLKLSASAAAGGP
ncbi:MAG TPA: inorganic phosphate transporter [Drouetiella sp.]